MSYRILIVDDSAIIRSIIKKSILMSGLEVAKMYEASNGIEALQKLKDQWIDIVFADINMPEMSGMELVEKMSEDNLMESIPVVIVSTKRSQEQIDELKKLGIKAYINKPFRPENFREVIRKIIGDAEGMSDE